MDNCNQALSILLSISYNGYATVLRLILAFPEPVTCDRLGILPEYGGNPDISSFMAGVTSMEERTLSLLQDSTQAMIFKSRLTFQKDINRAILPF